MGCTCSFIKNHTLIGIWQVESHWAKELAEHSLVLCLLGMAAVWGDLKAICLQDGK
jgi:hypothetical protein